MGRVTHPRPGKQVLASNGIRGAKVAKQRRRQKIVLEDVDEKKQKSLYFRSDPPAGYTFIPAGNPELTAALKEFAKKSNQEIFAVTTTPHASRHELSREVHRIGWHFPTQVVARVCAYYGIRLTASGRLVEDKDDDKLFMKVYQRGHLVLDEEVRDQITINTEAKQIIKDLFPNIPDNDLFQIIKTAFQLGDGKVGTADEIPLVRRAQLSVVAHIRHTYTNYDKLLREVPYTEARHRVENETLRKLIDWRGDEQDKAAVEDTLREVVVISDEEETDDEIDDGQMLNHEDLRVQLISNKARRDPAVGNRPSSPIEVHSDEEAPKGFRYVPQVTRRALIRDQPEVEIARQQSRYAVWDRYRQEYRSSVAHQSSHVVERIALDDTDHRSSNVVFNTRAPVHELQPQVSIPSPARLIRQQSPPTYVRGTNGRIYERIVIPPEPTNASVTGRSMPTPPLPGSTQYVRSRPVSPRLHDIRPPPHRRTVSYEGGDGSIIPSIEGPNGAKSLPNVRRTFVDNSPSGFPKRISGEYSTYPRHTGTYDLADVPDYMPKRRRIEATPPSPFLHRSGQVADSDELLREEGLRYVAQSHELRNQRSVHDVVDPTTTSLPNMNYRSGHYQLLQRNGGFVEADVRSVPIGPREPSLIQPRRVSYQLESPGRTYLPQDFHHQPEARSFGSRHEHNGRAVHVNQGSGTNADDRVMVYNAPTSTIDKSHMAHHKADYYARQPPAHSQYSRGPLQDTMLSGARRVSDPFQGQRLSQVVPEDYYSTLTPTQPNQRYRHSGPVQTMYIQN